MNDEDDWEDGLDELAGIEVAPPTAADAQAQAEWEAVFAADDARRAALPRPTAESRAADRQWVLDHSIDEERHLNIQVDAAAEIWEDEIAQRHFTRWLDTVAPDPGLDLSFAEVEPEAARAQVIADAQVDPVVPDRLVELETVHLARLEPVDGWTVFERFAHASPRTQTALLATLAPTDQAWLIMAANGYTPREMAQATHQPLATVQATLTALEAQLVVQPWSDPKPTRRRRS